MIRKLAMIKGPVHPSLPRLTETHCGSLMCFANKCTYLHIPLAGIGVRAFKALVWRGTTDRPGSPTHSLAMDLMYSTRVGRVWGVDEGPTTLNRRWLLGPLQRALINFTFSPLAWSTHNTPCHSEGMWSGEESFFNHRPGFTFCMDSILQYIQQCYHVLQQMCCM